MRKKKVAGLVLVSEIDKMRGIAAQTAMVAILPAKGGYIRPGNIISQTAGLADVDGINTAEKNTKRATRGCGIHEC